MPGEAVSAAAPASVPRRRRRLLRRVLLGIAAVVLAAVGYVVFSMGPRNVIGMLRYDQREEGKLRVGDPAPDVDLLALDGTTPVKLKDSVGGKPLVLVFGSFT